MKLFSHIITEGPNKGKELVGVSRDESIPGIKANNYWFEYGGISHPLDLGFRGYFETIEKPKLKAFVLGTVSEITEEQAKELGFGLTALKLHIFNLATAKHLRNNDESLEDFLKTIDNILLILIDKT